MVPNSIAGLDSASVKVEGRGKPEATEKGKVEVELEMKGGLTL
jgi:hypothetical protein